MARVDPDDDDLDRWVLQHHRYDPERHQRRNVTVAAFDSEVELHAAFDVLQADIERRRSEGAADPREHAIGMRREPGHARRQAYGRQVRRGVVATVDPDLLPPNVSVLDQPDGPGPGADGST